MTFDAEISRSNLKGPNEKQRMGEKGERGKAGARKRKQKGETRGTTQKEKEKRKREREGERKRGRSHLLQRAGTSQPGADCWHEALTSRQYRG